jgi:hypothetical protein
MTPVTGAALCACRNVGIADPLNPRAALIFG